MSNQRSFRLFFSLTFAVVGLGLSISGCSSEQVSQQEESGETKNQKAAVSKPQDDVTKDVANSAKEDATKDDPSKEIATEKKSDGDTPEKTPDKSAENEVEKSDDSAETPKTPKPNNETPPSDSPAETKPKEAGPKDASNRPTPSASDKPENIPQAAEKKPAQKNRTEEKTEVKRDNPFAPAADLDSDGLMQFIIDRINERGFIQRLPGFTDGVIEAADRVIASDASSGNKSAALFAKFKILYEASLASEKGADEKLFRLAEQQKDNTSRKAAAFVRFVNMERRLLESKTLKADQSLALVDDLKTYLAKHTPGDRQLRMAVLTAHLILSLDKKKQKPLFEEFGRLYANSSHLDLKQFGQRLGKPPTVDIDQMEGKPLELTGMTTSNDKFEWAAYRGDVVIVDFWTTWYGPCVRDVSHLLGLYHDHAGNGLEIVGVSLDANRYRLKSFLSSNNIPWVTTSGKEAQQAAVRYGVRTVPTLLLIGRDGKVIARSDRLEDLLKHLGAALAVKREDVKVEADAETKKDAKAKPSP